MLLALPFSRFLVVLGIGAHPRVGMGWIMAGIGLAATVTAPHGIAQQGDRTQQQPATSNAAPVRTARASLIDPRVQAYPEIDFLLERDGKPVDVGHACVSSQSPRKNRLVVWMMGYSPELFQWLADDGFHVLRVHYANGWFSKFGQEPPPEDRYALGKIRLEAATGEDFSPMVQIAQPDGMQERVRQFLIWLDGRHPEEGWSAYLTEDRNGVRWDRVIVSGASHGATTSARFALHQKVDRVVMFCGPRDQYESWQSLPSATERERFFGFSHTLDTGWSGDHYCRSWEMLGLAAFGPIVDTERSAPPYENTRRLITQADVAGDAKRAHSCVTPGKSAVRDAEGNYLHAPVWRYLFNHPIDAVGRDVPSDPDCQHEQRRKAP